MHDEYQLTGTKQCHGEGTTKTHPPVHCNIIGACNGFDTRARPQEESSRHWSRYVYTRIEEGSFRHAYILYNVVSHMDALSPSMCFCFQLVELGSLSFLT